MITLDQAIKLATEAHKKQWRKSESLGKTNIKSVKNISPYNITTNHIKVIDILCTEHLVQDMLIVIENDKYCFIGLPTTGNIQSFETSLGIVTKRWEAEDYPGTLQKPYITHPLAVMEMMNTEEEKIIAVLHDVFENCKNYALGRIMDNSKFYIRNRETLDEYIITASIYQALMLLSKEKHINYTNYIHNIVNGQPIPDIIDRHPNKLAIKIKIVDMMHNMSETTNQAQKDKYLKALPILLKEI